MTFATIDCSNELGACPVVSGKHGCGMERLHRVADEVGGVEGKDSLDAVDIHGGDEPRVVHFAAENVVFGY